LWTCVWRARRGRRLCNFLWITAPCVNTLTKLVWFWIFEFPWQVTTSDNNCWRVIVPRGCRRGGDEIEATHIISIVKLYVLLENRVTVCIVLFLWLWLKCCNEGPVIGVFICNSAYIMSTFRFVNNFILQ